MNIFFVWKASFKYVVIFSTFMEIMGDGFSINRIHLGYMIFTKESANSVTFGL